jgi:O-Antigen ligase
MSISSLLFLSIFLILSAFCIVRSPVYGIFLYEFVYFMNPQARWWYVQVPHYRYSFFIVLLIVVGCFLRSDRFIANKIFDVPLSKWLLLLTCIVLLSWFWGVDNVYYEMLITRYLKYIFFIFLMYKIIDSRRDLDIALVVYMVGIFYICFIAWQMGRGGSARLEGIGVPDGEEVNGTAAAVVSAVPMLAYMVLFSAKKWMQFLALIGLTFVLNGLILLNSRGAFLAVVISMGWMAIVIFKEKGLKSQKWKFILGSIGGVFLFFYLADNLFWERMNTMATLSTEVEGGNRVLYWWKTFEMLADHPLGTGIAGYEILSPQYLPSEWLTHGRRAVHSTWFEVLSSFGYQGFIAFMGYIFSTLLFTRKVKKYLRARGELHHELKLVSLEASFIAFLVAATFINRFYAEMLYWLPALLAVFGNIYMIKPLKEEGAGQPSSNL